MRIAYFVWEYEPKLVGGLGVYACEMTRRIQKLGNEVHVFTLNHGNSLPVEEEISGIKVYRPRLTDATNILPLFVNDDLKGWGSYLKFFNDVLSYNLLSYKILKELVEGGLKFDLVVCHDWLSAFAGLLAKHELNLPFVFHIHSLEEQRTFGRGSRTVEEIERETANKADRVITVSNSMRDFLQFLGYPMKKVKVIHNGVDPDKYDPKKVSKKALNALKKRYEVKKGEKIIFFIGRLTWVKGVQNLVKSLPFVLRDYPETKLIIVGIGEELENIQRIATELKVDDRIFIRSEWLKEDEKKAHFALADVCVFPSLTEPFGIVCSEAMSMQKPVVVGAAGEVNGLKEQVIPFGEEKTGIHVNGSNPEDIAWGIKSVFENEKEARKWGKNGRKRVKELFNWDLVVEKTLKVYESCVRG